MMKKENLNSLLGHFAPANTPAHNTHFITFEGIEGCGKSTQISLFQNYLVAQGYHVHCYREPGSTTFGEGLRTAMLSSTTAVAPLAQALLFASARAQLLTQEILPRLKEANTVVLVDRYIDSSLIYQGVAGALGIETVLSLHAHAPLTTLPHLTFVLDIPLATSLQRQRQRGGKADYFESQKEDYTAQLIRGLDQVATLFPKRIARIRGDQAVELVAHDIICRFQDHLHSTSAR